MSLINGGPGFALEDPCISHQMMLREMVSDISVESSPYCPWCKKARPNGKA